MYNQELLEADQEVYNRILAIGLFDNELSTVFEYMYLSGCRSGELWLMDQATRNQAGIWTVKTLKNNFNRILNYENQSEFLDVNLETLLNYTANNRKNEIWRMSNRYLSGIYDFEIEKDVNTYLLRYCYVNRLMFNGYDLEAVKVNLGHRSTTATTDYFQTILGV